MGIRRCVHRIKDADFYISPRTRGALGKAELALVLTDTSESSTEQDIRVMQQAIGTGHTLVVVCNKWDLVDEHQRRELDRGVDRDLMQVQWAEYANLSAAMG